jgi:hypothetical protein
MVFGIAPIRFINLPAFGSCEITLQPISIVDSEKDTVIRCMTNSFHVH